SGARIHGYESGRDRNGYKLYEKPVHRLDNLGDIFRYDSLYRLQTYLPNVFDVHFPPSDPLESLVFLYDGNHSWRFIQVNFSIRRIEVNARGAYIESDGDPLTSDANGGFGSPGGPPDPPDALGGPA